jgi:PiT family inorganic phosphate transporter
MFLLLVALTFIAVALVAGNNLSACVGPAIGSKVISQRLGILIGITGFVLGLVIQGSSMTHTTSIILQDPTLQLREEALLVAIAIFLIAYLLRAPISLTMSLVGLLAGLSIAQKAGISPSITWVVAMWFIGPVVAVISTFSILKLSHRTVPKNVWRRVQVLRLLLIVLSFTTSYVLGANTLGLIVATGGFDTATLLAAIAAIVVGSVYLSRGPIRRVSQEMFLMRYQNATAVLLMSTVLVEAATILGLPLSNTETLSAAVFGAGISYKAKFISLRPFWTILAGWVIAPLLSFAIGLII